MTTEPEVGREWVAGAADALRRALDGEDTAPGDGLQALLVGLLRSNLAQWRLEDESRRPDATDADIGRTKRDIDGLNGRRHQLVEQIDAAIADAIEQRATAPPATESPAMAFDRLSVLIIRIHETEGLCDPDRDARLARLGVQVATLEEALGGLLDEVRAGTRRFVPYRGLKLYRG
ncbi:MAG: DUF4254 domain-containing protein [Acidimicrobiales bacterium]